MKNLLLTFTVFLLFNALLFSQPDTLTILHVNDSHSTLEAIGPRDANLKGTLGGVSRIATLVGMTKITEPNVLFLHSGDISIGDLFFNKNFQVPELQILNALDLDAMTVGNHEFDLGPEALLGSIQYAFPIAADAFPMLTANIDFSDPTISDLQNYVTPYTIKEFGDLKVGIFGLTTPATNLISNPSPAVVSEDIVNIAATTVGTLRSSENCDVVILLSHLGIDLDKVIAQFVPGINVIVGGHDHYKYEQPITLTDPMGGTTWIVQAGSNYLNAGKMSLLVDGTDVQLINYQLIPIDSNIPQEPTIQAIVDNMITDIESFYGIPFFTQQLGYANSFFSEEAEELLQIGTHDTPIGNLVADAFRSFTSTDISIQATGSTALPLWQGNFTPGDIFRINGYGFNVTNTLGFQLVTFNLTGADILTGLTFGLTEIENTDEYLLQVSGIEYTYDGTKPVNERLVSAKINNDQINPTATYSVTANEFSLMFLNYLGITPTNVNILTGVTEFQALYQYIMQQNNFIQPKILGRVLNVGNRESKNTIVGLGSLRSSQTDYDSELKQCDRILFDFLVTDRGLNYDPMGIITIRFQSLNKTFKSSKCEWLLRKNNIATLKGIGKINNRGNYGYLLIAKNSPDKLQIVIWDKNDGDKIIFDNLSPQNIQGFINMYSWNTFYKDVPEEILSVPISSSLEQNYPNPFNPTTTIKYSIQTTSDVKIKVYDIIGNEVAILVNEVKEPGNYSVEFNAASLASGVYIYTITADNFFDSKKLILLK